MASKKATKRPASSTTSRPASTATRASTTSRPLTTPTRTSTAGSAHTTSRPLKQSGSKNSDNTLERSTSESHDLPAATAARPVNASRYVEQQRLSRQDVRMQRRAEMRRRRNTVSFSIVLVALIGVVAIALAVLQQNGAFNAPVTKPKPVSILSDFPNQLVAISSIKPAPKVTTTADGLQYVDLKVGTGATAAANQKVTVNYTGWLTDGTVFDSSLIASFQHQQPASFSLDTNSVIQGWVEGVPGMKVGGIRRLWLPAALAYGANPPSTTIPANATLVFDIQLVSIP